MKLGPAVGLVVGCIVGTSVGVAFEAMTVESQFILGLTDGIADVTLNDGVRVGDADGEYVGTRLAEGAHCEPKPYTFTFGFGASPMPQVVAHSHCAELPT